MGSTKKFYLLDASQLKAQDDHNLLAERSKPIDKRELESLDRLMLDIINNKSLTQEEKVNRYNTALAEYQEAKTFTTPKLPDAEAKTKQQNNENEDVSSYDSKKLDYDPLMGIPKTYANKAARLLELLLKSNRLKVRDNGEIDIDEKQIDGSNITDMLNTAVNPKAKKASLSGWSSFKNLIRETNVPKLLYIQTPSDDLFSESPSTSGTSKRFKTPTGKGKSLIKWQGYKSK